MTTVVVGAGAIGLLVAGRLAAAGEEVTVVARTSTAALRQGVTVIPREPAAPASAVAVQTATPEDIPRSLRGAHVVLAVKGYQTAGALPALHALEPQSVLTLQNGLGNEEILIGALGEECVTAGIITASVEVRDATTVALRREGGIGIAPTGAEATGNPSRVDGWQRLLRRAFRTRVYDDFRAMKWSKALLNILGNGTPAVLNWDIGRVYRERRLVELEREIFREALRTMRALGLKPVDVPGYPVRLLAAAMEWLPLAALRPLLVRVMGQGRGGKAPSLLLDLQRGRRESEAETLYGAIARAAAAAGVAAPANAVLCELLLGLAGGSTDREAWADRPERLLAAVRERAGGRS